MSFWYYFCEYKKNDGTNPDIRCIKNVMPLDKYIEQIKKDSLESE